MGGGRHARRQAPVLLFGGAGVLLGRTIALLGGGAARVLRPWVVALTWIEMAVDAVTMAGALRWFRSGDPAHARLPMRAGATAALLHAARVAVFILGRTRPCRDFDVRPEKRADHDERWTWGQVVFAGVMSIAGVVGVAVVWRSRRAVHDPAHGSGRCSAVVSVVARQDVRLCRRLDVARRPESRGRLCSPVSAVAESEGG
jgi:hypothetical protein